MRTNVLAYARSDKRQAADTAARATASFIASRAHYYDSICVIIMRSQYYEKPVFIPKYLIIIPRNLLPLWI
jgi:hypothetical protein